MSQVRHQPSLVAVRQTAGRGAARAAARRRGSTAGAERRPGWVTYVLLGVVLAVSAYPLYYAFLLASSDASTIAQNPIPSLVPGPHFLENVTRVLGSDINFLTALRNSTVVAVVTAVSVVFFSTLAGFAFARLGFRGRRPLLVFVIATMAVPTQLGVVPLFILMSDLGWVGKLQAVIVPGLVTAFGVFWMTQYLDSALPQELIEAARVDGCWLIGTFWHVALPAARPAAAMLALFTFVASWTNFFWPFVVLGPSNPTLPVAVQLLQASHFKDMSLIMAGVVVSTAPLVVLFVVVGRQLVSGIMHGAVKG
ncbi:carbohydrate ABC transporter permease [Cellulomonas bogoriensis]|uniref:Sugar ABC transporter permease n=1 Tax=Cellulomonas bogoriensis 69B4 = DSM 16987 TaxID=1386082 RepID=A0A0A0BX93_9CELL|nr:carbohydrate ABC transporter permease [Cellulomonas bogoriensis]KGM13033.1 sugar ABC transporter permease [Cellulomonas bogoriensis 69B4 = DSM 16987]